jgi:NADPH:quinone reductase-like Zn-dependent oxidoreductase
MRAIVVTKPGGPDVLAVQELPDPVPAAGEVLIAVKAFGLNHADTFMRGGQWPSTPVIGIECAGVVELDSTGTFALGSKVVAIVGGMARDRNGSYAERVAVPVSNVVALDTDLSWADLAALPEAYATAWVALHRNLALEPDQTLVVRGATSALGQAAVNLAVDHGARVIASTRAPERRELLLSLGAAEVLIDDGALAERVRRSHPGGVDCFLDLVGNSVLRDSLQTVRAHGRLCQAGFLGGLAPVADFNPIVDLPSGVQLSFFASAFVLGNEDYPLSGVPLQDIVAKAASGVFDAKPKRVFGFEEIVEAHRLMDAAAAGGKLVVAIAA